jgi:hypothetical protein
MYMLLIREKQKIEISHYHHLLSCYESTPQMVEELRQDIKEALVKAKKTKETQIVSQDRVDFCLHIHPSGSISLMAAIKEFDSVKIT